MIFVLTNSTDATADYLCALLVARNLDFLRLDTDNCLDHLRIKYQNGSPRLSLNGRSFQPEEIRHLWFRRPLPLPVTVGRDSEEVRHSAKEWSEALEGFLAHIPNSRWINHPSNNTLASHKIEQLSRASRFGLSIPRTLLTQSPSEFRDFWKKCGRNVIVKPLGSGVLERDNPTNDTHIYTTQVKKCNLPKLSSLAACPTLFQQLIDKEFDVRVTVIDGEFQAVALSYPESYAKTNIDIRHNSMKEVRYTKIALPRVLKNRLSKLISSYHLRFAASDFGVDKSGQWHFFEINPNGQWAWLDLAGFASIGNMITESLAKKEKRNK